MNDKSQGVVNSGFKTSFVNPKPIVENNILSIMKNTSTANSSGNRKLIFTAIFTLLMVFFAPLGMNGATDGWGSSSDNSGQTYSTQNSPFGRYYGWEYKVFCYRPNTLNFSGDISKIAFLPATTQSTAGTNTNSSFTANGSTDSNPMQIWMKEVDGNTTLDASTSFQAYVTGATKVYSGNIPATTSGTMTSFTLSTAFTHSQENCLLILVRTVANGDTGDGSVNAYYKELTGGLNLVWYQRDDNNDPGINTTADGVVTNNLPVLQVTYTVQSCQPQTPTNVAVNSVTYNSASVSWTGGNNSNIVQYGAITGYSNETVTLVSESFNGSDWPTGWGYTSTNWSISSSNNAGSTANEVHLNWSPRVQNSTTRLITPACDLRGIDNVTFTFKHTLDFYSGNYTRILGIATSSDDGTTWNEGWSRENFSADITAETINEVIATTDMGKSNVLFCIYFEGDSYGFDDWYFDDVGIVAEKSVPTYDWTTASSSATSPYILSGLDPETDYAVRVIGVCNGVQSDPSAAVSFTTEEAPAMCAVTLVLNDEWGDGWNGGKMEVVNAATNEVLGSYTLSSGSTTIETLDVLDGTTIKFVYTPGSYAYENGFVITDPNDQTIAEHVGCRNSNDCTAHATGVVATYTMNCSSSASCIHSISSTAEWDEFCSNVNSGTCDYYNETVTLEANISNVSTMAGTASHPFKGTFEGNTHTITVNIDNSGDGNISSDYQGAAPFRYIDGATIQNVNVTGIVKTSAHHASGLVGFCKNNSTNTIYNCHVSTSVTNETPGIGDDKNNYMGGLIGHNNNATTNIVGCVFDGTLTSEGFRGGMFGFGDYNSTINITDSYFNGNFSPSQVQYNDQYYENFSPIGVHSSGRNVNLSFSNFYYSKEVGSFSHSGYNGTDNASITGTAMHAYSVTSGTNTTVAMSGSPTQTYNVSGITAYDHGMMYGGQIYGGYSDSGYDILPLTLGYTGGSIPAGSELSYYADHGALEGSNPTGTNDEYTLAMSNNNTIINANVFHLKLHIVSSISDPSTQMLWTEFAANVNHGYTYSGKTVYLDNDITVDRMAGASGDVPANTHPFSGIFEGQGNTITVNYTASDWNCTAPFRCIYGATIRDLRTTGTINMGSYKYAGGLVGESYGNNTITNCESNVTINSSVNGDGTHGGFIAKTRGQYPSGYDEYTTTFTGCAFTGSLLGANTKWSGGFVGFDEYGIYGSSGKVVFNDCLFAPAEVTMIGEWSDGGGSATFSRYRESSKITLNNCYYTQPFGTAQGKQAYTVEGINGVTATMDGAPTYTVSGITVYGDDKGIKHNGTIYGANGDELDLLLSYGGTFYEYVADHGTLSGSELTGTNDEYTLEMEASDTKISVITCPQPTGLAVDNITASTATVSWVGPGDSYVVRYGVPQALFYEDFDNGMPAGWSNIDADNDGNVWVSSYNPGIYHNAGVDLSGSGHNSSEAYVISGSFANQTGEELTPDNWLITPAIQLPSDVESLNLKFYASAQDVNYAAEHYGVYISTTVADDTDAFTLLWDEDMDADGGPHRGGTWGEKNTDISAYAGQTVYIAIRHFDCTNMFILNIDDFGVYYTEWNTLNVDDSPAELTGLSPATTYECEVRSNCGSDVSEWISTTFTTECAAIDVTGTWTEDFESVADYSIPDCWKRIVGYDSWPYVYSDSYYAHGGDGYLYMYHPSAENIIALPPMNNINTLMISLWAKASEIPKEIEIGYVSNGAFTMVESFNLTTEYQQYATSFVNVPDYAERIAIRSADDDYYYVYIDDINIGTCLPPVSLNVSDTTSTTANLNWTGNSDSYTVRYREPAYYVGISETFDENSIPTGWTRYSGLVDNVIAGTATLSTTTYGWGPTTYALGSYNMKVNIYGTYNYWLVTPEQTLETGSVLNFDLALTAYNSSSAASGTCDDDRFVVLIYANDTWTILREWNNDGSSYVYNSISTTGQNVNIDLSAYNGQTVKIAFYGESTTGSNGDNDLHIDNVQLGVPVAATDWETVEVNTTTATITGLTPLTNYEWQVQGVCDGSPTDWSDINTFTTLDPCHTPYNLVTSNVAATSADLSWTGSQQSYNVRYREVITAPVEYTYDFEDGTTQGWTTIDADGHGDAWSVYSYNGNSDPYCMMATYNYSYAHQDYLVSPEIPLGGTLSFFAKRYSSSYTDKFRVYLSTGGNNSSDFTIELTNGDVTPNTSYGEYTYDLSAYSGTGYVAIVYNAPANQYYLYIDDITIVEPGEYGSWITLNGVTSPSTITGLNPDTNYEWQVQGVNCDGLGGTTDWSELMTFTTPLCDIINITVDNPWTEDFEGYDIVQDQASPLSRCWATPLSHQNSYPSGIKSPYVFGSYKPAAHNGSKSVELKSNTSDKIMLVLPEFENDLNTLAFEFYANSNGNDTYPEGVMEIGYITDVNDPSTFQVLYDNQKSLTPRGSSGNNSACKFMGPYCFASVNEPGRIAIRYTSGTSAGSNQKCTNIDDLKVYINVPDIDQTLSSYDYIWRGTTSTDWNTSSNWYLYDSENERYSVASGVMPTVTKSYYIGTGGQCMPEDQWPILDADVNVRNITITEDAALSIEADRTLSISGNIENNGILTVGDNSSIIFNGSLPQTVSGSSLPLYNVTFNNTNGGITFDGVEPIVSNQANFISGIVNGDMAFGASASSTGAKIASHVNGTVTKTGNGSSFVFPTGNDNVLGTITATVGSGKVATVKFNHSTATNADGTHGFTLEQLPRWWNINDMCSSDGASRFDHVSNYEYWNVTTTEALSGITLIVDAADAASHFSTAPADGPNENICAAAHYNCWKNLGGSANVSEGNITVTGFNLPLAISRAGDVDFSGILTLGSKSEDVVLPIELTSFTATCDGRSALVEWTTATERNNDYFSLERSDDAINFVEVARVAGAGNSIDPIDYAYTDYGIHGGDNYYRLVQVDYDGTRTVSDIVLANCVEMSDGEPDVMAYPNPFNDDITVVLDNFGNRVASIEVYDMLGRLVMFRKADSPQNNYEMVLHLGSLPPATYNIRVSTADFVINKQVVKN